MSTRISVLPFHSPRRLVVLADVSHELALQVGDGSEDTSGVSAPNRGWRRSAYIDCLRLSGARRWDLLNDRLTELERELQPRGYRSLEEVMGEFDFGLSMSDVLTIEVAAEPILCIAQNTRLRGRTAEISVALEKTLATDQVTLTVVDAESGGRAFRHSIDGNELCWTTDLSNSVGTCTLDLPINTLLICRGLYAGSLHDEVELADAEALPNIRRTLVELADPGLQRLRGPLTAPKSNQEQNEFEAGANVLLYMLGFEVVRVGGIKKLSAAADIFARTPAGYTLVVECTTAVLDPKDKIGKLLIRLDDARGRLSKAVTGFKPGSVIGMIMIPKMRNELGSEWRAAEERGLIVLCRSDLEAALERTRFSPNADLVLRDWLQIPIRELQTQGFNLVDQQ